MLYIKYVCNIVQYNINKESIIHSHGRQFERNHLEEDIMIRDIRYTFLRS